jgi:isovaleryl-CoA dehydrogenase
MGGRSFARFVRSLDDLDVQGVQAMGGAGYLADSPLARIMRDAKLMEIGAGTSEIRRMLIGRELMKATA